MPSSAPPSTERVLANPHKLHLIDWPKHSEMTAIAKIILLPLLRARFCSCCLHWRTGGGPAARIFVYDLAYALLLYSAHGVPPNDASVWDQNTARG